MHNCPEISDAVDQHDAGKGVFRHPLDTQISLDYVVIRKKIEILT